MGAVRFLTEKNWERVKRVWEELKPRESWDEFRARCEAYAETSNRETSAWIEHVRLVLSDSLLTDGVACELLERAFKAAVGDTRWEEMKDAIHRDDQFREQFPDVERSGVHDEMAIAFIDALARKSVPKATSVGKWQVRDAIREEAAGKLLMAFTRFDACRPFSPWAITVLSRNAISRGRRERTVHNHKEPYHHWRMAIGGASNPDKPAPIDRVEDYLEEVFGLLRDRSLVKRLLPRRADGVDRLATFLFELRLRIASDGESLDRFPLERFPAWEPYERVRQFQRGWPRLGEMWDCLRSLSPMATYPSRQELFLATCGEVRPQGVLAPRWTSDVWNGWVHDAKSAIRTAIGEELWTKYFSGLFPDQAR